MLKVMFAVLCFVLAGTASAAGWRSLRMDASSEDSFKESVALFQDKLSPSRRHAFELALQDIWTQRTQTASAEPRDFTRADYLAQLDGLAYDEIVKLLDPSGSLAKRYRAAYYDSQARGSIAGSAVSTPWPSQELPPVYGGMTYRGGPQARPPNEY